MAIRLSLDLVDSTCADLLRFADSLRAAGAPPGRTLTRGGPPDCIEVVLDGPPEPSGQYPPGVPGGPVIPGPGPAYPATYRSGPPPGPPAGPHSHLPPPVGMFGPYPAPGATGRRGAVIQISEDGLTHESHVSAETLYAWRTAISQALEAGSMPDSARAALLELREMLSSRRRFGGGS
jgi:hypothetical protein